MKCRKIEKYWIPYLEGKIGRREAGLVEEHIRNCPDCAKLLEELKRIVKTLGNIPGKKIPEGLMEQTIERIYEGKTSPDWMLFFTPWKVLSFACAIVLLLILTRTGKRYEGVVQEAEITKGIETAEDINFPEKDISITETILSFVAAEAGESFTVMNYGSGETDDVLKEKLGKLKLTVIEITPEVEQIFRRRIKDMTMIKRLKKEEIIGEGNKGLLIILDKKKITPFEEEIVKSENYNRKRLLEIFVEQFMRKKEVPRNLKDKVKKRIQTIFAETFHKLAVSGEWFQTSNGKWEKTPK